MKKPSFFRLLEKIFKDVLLLYKNFIHWGISKLIIGIVWYCLGFALALPFLLLVLLFGYIDGIDWAWVVQDIQFWVFSTVSAEQIFSEFYMVIFEWLLLITAVFSFFVWWTYSVILQFFLYKNYIEGEKLKYVKNFYFDIQKFKVFLGVLLWTMLYCSIPVLWGIIVLAVILGIYIMYFWSIEAFSSYIFLNEYTLFSILVLWICIIIALLFLYVNFRLYFANVFFSDDFSKSRIHTSKKYLETSISHTKWWKKIVKFMAVFIVFWVILSFITTPYTQVKDESARIEFFVNNYGYTWALTVEQQDIFDTYKDLSYEQADKRNAQYLTLSLILSVFYFFLTSGVMEMVVFSFYRHVIKE